MQIIKTDVICPPNPPANVGINQGEGEDDKNWCFPIFLGPTKKIEQGGALDFHRSPPLVFDFPKNTLRAKGKKDNEHEKY